MTTEELSRLLSAKTVAQPKRPGEPWILVVSGYPFTGKTTVSKDVVRRFPRGSSCLIPTECFILSRAERADLGVDGCAVAAYAMDQMVDALARLKAGHVVQLRTYSWERGELLDEFIDHRADPNGVVVIDGTVAIDPRVLRLANFAVFFRCEESAQWLSGATDRDAVEREWPAVRAEEENRSKHQTTSRLLASAVTSVDLIVETIIRPEGTNPFEFRPAEAAS